MPMPIQVAPALVATLRAYAPYAYRVTPALLPTLCADAYAYAYIG